MPKPLIVVLDSNIWMEHQLLRSALGAALIHKLIRANGKIGLPEIVEMELKSRVREFAKKAFNDIHRHGRTLHNLSGHKVRLRLPEEEQLGDGTQLRLEELGNLVLRLPFKFEHAQKALKKVIGRIPPNTAKSEQFRDTAIWEATLEKASDFDIHFVTGDNGFFENQESRKVLASALKEEVEASPGIIECHDSLGACLHALEAASVPEDTDLVLDMIEQEIKSDLASAAATKGFSLGGRDSGEVELFPTEIPSAAAIKFSMSFAIADDTTAREVARSDATVKAVGVGTFDPINKSLTDVHFDSQDFRWQDDHGEWHQARNVFGRITIGGVGETFEPVWFEGIVGDRTAG